MSKEKARHFTFLLYPESLPSDWLGKLQDSGYAIAVSPLHNLDATEKKYEELKPDEQAVIDAGGVVYKKAHYHVILIAHNTITADAIRKKMQRLLGVQAIAKVKIINTTVANVYLYFTHETRDAIAKNKHISI